MSNLHFNSYPDGNTIIVATVTPIIFTHLLQNISLPIFIGGRLGTKGLTLQYQILT